MPSEGSRTFICGRSGSGKTTLARSLIGKSRVVIFDPMQEYGGRGTAVCHSLPAVLAALKKRWRNPSFKVAYVPPAGREPEALSRLSIMLRDIQAVAGRSRLMLVAEELNLGFPVSSLPRDYQGFSELCSRGRHYRIDLIGLSQRPAEVNTRFRGNTNETYVFPIAGHADVKTVLAMIGPSHRQALDGLKVHDYLRIKDGQITRGRNVLRRRK